MELINKITLDDLTEDQRQLAELLGLENYINLLKTYGGTYVYIQKVESISKSIRNAAINREFNGYNYKQLARRYQLTEIMVRNIVHEQEQEMKQRPIDGQINF